MELGSTVRRGVMVAATTLVVMAAGTLPGASASSDSTTVVRGTAFPAGNRAQLTVVGCDDVFQRSAEPVRPQIGLATGAGATGERSLGFDTAGGSATGIVSYVESIADTSVAGVSVHAEGGTTGVAYVGYQAPADVGTSTMWIGRASLTAPASTGWTTVDVPGLGYAWTQYDLATQQPVGGQVGSSGVPAFVQAMGGDGYGFYAVGFGCDGNPFNIDAWRIGSPGATATYDIEGYGTRTSIAGPTEPVAPDQRVTLTGRVVDDLGAPVSSARVVLQALKPHGDPGDENDWETVRVVVGSSVAVTLRARETTTYRWKVFATPMAGGSASAPLEIKVVDPADEPTDPPSQEPEQTEQPDQAEQAPSQQPAGQPSGPTAPAQQPTEGQQPAPKAPAPAPPESSSPAAEPTPSPTPSTAPSATTTPDQPAVTESSKAGPTPAPEPSASGGTAEAEASPAG